MRFVVTEQDMINNPILKKRGYMIGDIAETTQFPHALRLKPSAQERVSGVVSLTPSPEWKEPTLEETAGEITEQKQEIKVEEPKVVAKKVAKPSAKKQAKKK